LERVVRHFQEELETLQARLLEMGGLAEERVRAAVQGLMSRDVALIDKVLYGDEPINELHIEVDKRCFRLLALYQPMATDLRAIVAAVKINTDLERVGDLAVNIAEAAKRYATHPPVKRLVDIPRMTDLAQAMLRDALDSFVRRDTALAQRVLNEDDVLEPQDADLPGTAHLHAAGSHHRRAVARLDSHLPPPRTHRRPCHEHCRGRHLHGVCARRPPSGAQRDRVLAQRVTVRRRIFRTQAASLLCCSLALVASGRST